MTTARRNGLNGAPAVVAGRRVDVVINYDISELKMKPKNLVGPGQARKSLDRLQIGLLGRAEPRDTHAAGYARIGIRTC